MDTYAVQVALTVFVILFAILVAVAFFMILWHRPFVFYSPSEYGDVDPTKFIHAIKQPPSSGIAQQVELVREIEQNPDNRDAQHNLVNSLLDENFRQHIILMHEKGVDLPYADTYSHKFQLGTRDKHFGNGVFPSRDFVNKLEGTPFGDKKDSPTPPEDGEKK